MLLKWNIGFPVPAAGYARQESHFAMLWGIKSGPDAWQRFRFFVGVDGANVWSWCLGVLG